MKRQPRHKPAMSKRKLRLLAQAERFPFRPRQYVALQDMFHLCAEGYVEVTPTLRYRLTTKGRLRLLYERAPRILGGEVVT